MIETERLLLRPFTAADAPAVQELASARSIAAGTLSIPHPYPEGAAAEWIASHGKDDAHIELAIVLRDGDAVIGATGLGVAREHERAELGYWIGEPYWGQGYATEAGRAVVQYGFDDLGLNRIQAHHFTSNPASGRVLEKIGMTHEGTHRQMFRKWGEYKDVEAYSILRSQFE